MRARFAFVMALAMAASTAQAAPCAGFLDTDDTTGPTAGFCADITWMRNRGVTLGCTATLYCPSDAVSRLQMAAFMHRLGEALFPSTCSPGQVMKWSGTEWGCAADGTGGTGSVTSLAAGTGLQGTPGTITSTGTVTVASSYRLPQACSNGQVAKSNGAGGWSCAGDANAGGTVTSVVTGTGLTGGPVTTSGTVAVNTTVIQARITGACAAGASIRAINADGSVACEVDDNAGASAFVQGGNAFAAPARIGTTDVRSLQIRAGGGAMRYEPDSISANVVGGSTFNFVAAGVRGTTIAGGGTNISFANPDPDFTGEGPNAAYGRYASIGGGLANTTGFEGTNDPQSDSFGTISGGRSNNATSYSTVRGGWNNRTSLVGALFNGGAMHAIGGGVDHRMNFSHNSIGGGRNNTMENVTEAVIVGGIDNRLEHTVESFPPMAIAGGTGNFATSPLSISIQEGTIVLGGQQNGAHNHSAIAAGARAVADAGKCVVFSLWSGSSSGQSCFVPPNDAPGVLLGGPQRFRIGADNGFSVDYAAQRPDGGGTRWVYIGPLLGDNAITAWNGARLSNAGDWLVGSDRNTKENFEPVDDRILEGVAGLPITRWFYRVEGPRIQHIGPMAQDFRAAFGLGHGDRTISTIDVAGVALAAIQGLHRRFESTRTEIEALHRDVDAILERLEIVQEP